MTRIGKKLAAVLLAVAMVVTFMPVMGNMTVGKLGVQTAYADGDIEAPIPDPDSIAVEVIGKSGNVAVPGDTVRITMEITDETSVWDWMYFKKPISGGDAYETRKGRVEGTDTYWWEIDISDSMEDGTWKIGRFKLEDNVGNEQWYFNSDGIVPDDSQPYVYMDFSQADFVVSGTTPDMEGPEIDMGSIQVSPSNAVPGDTVTMALSATDASGVMEIDLFIKRPNGTVDSWKEMDLNGETGKYEYKWEITNESLNGKWVVYYIRTYDNAGNMKEFGDEEAEIAFFNVSGAANETDPPEIDYGNLVVEYPNAQDAVTPGQKVSIGTWVTDATGIRFVQFCYILPQTGTDRFLVANYNTDTGRWDCGFDVPDTAQTGVWKLRYIEAEDLLGNNIKIYNSDTSGESPSADLSDADFTVKRSISKAVVTGIPASVTYSGEAFTPEPTLVDPTNGEDKLLTENVDYTVNYYQNVNAGEALVEIRGKGDYSGSVVESFTIDPKTVSPTVTLSKSTLSYDGKVQKPTVTVMDGSTKLVASDYTVTYSPSGCKDAGTYKVYVTLKGNYTGAGEASFEITPKKITPAVTLSTSAYTWNGKVKKPTVTVKDGSTKLAASQYTVTYASGCKDVGKYSAKVALKGNYSGEKTLSFVINPKGTSLSKVTKAKKAATVKWKKQSAKMSSSRITGYQILLATDSKFTKNKKTVTVKGYSKTSKKVTKLKGGKKYYVKIRTYKTVRGTNYYSTWSKVKTVTTKK